MVFIYIDLKMHFKYQKEMFGLELKCPVKTPCVPFPDSQKRKFRGTLKLNNWVVILPEERISLSASTH